MPFLKHVVTSSSLALLLMTGACSNSQKNPSVTDNIRKSLDQAGLKDVSVSQDRDKGVVNLKGHVPNAADKAQADAIAKANAAGQVVANEVAVEPPNDTSTAKTVNSDLDGAIKKNLDAALAKNHLNKQVKYTVQNGVVKLTGKVNSQGTRSEAEKIATNVPNVQQVINEVEVRYQRATARK